MVLDFLGPCGKRTVSRDHFPAPFIAGVRTHLSMHVEVWNQCSVKENSWWRYSTLEEAVNCRQLLIIEISNVM